MSARICGCDLEQDYVCEQHRTEPQEYGNVYERAVANTDWYREHVTKTAATLLAMQPQPPRLREATPIEESLIDVQRVADRLMKELQSLARSVEALQVEKVSVENLRTILQHAYENNSVAYAARAAAETKLTHIIEVLSVFVHAPISLSSLQPVLDLAYELNPSLRNR